MPDVRDGLVHEDGHPMFEGGEKTDPFASAGNGPAQKPATSATDPSLDKAEDLKAAMLSNEGSTALRDGFTTRDDPTPAPNLEQFGEVTLDGHVVSGAELHAALTRAGTEIPQLESDAASGRDAQETLRVQQFLTDLDDAGSDEERSALFAELQREVSTEAFESALDFLQSDAGWGEDDEDVVRFENEANFVNAMRDFVESEKAIEQLRPIVDAKHDAAVKAELNAIAKEQQLTSEQLDARLEPINENLQREAGVTLVELANRLDPATFGSFLRDAVGTVGNMDKAYGDRAFKEGIASADSTDVSAGLSRMTPWGEMKLQPQLPAFDLEAAAEKAAEQARARTQAPRETVGDLKRAMAEPDTRSVADGFEVNGKPQSQAEASGARARWLKERAEAQAAARAMLPGGGGRARD